MRLYCLSSSENRNVYVIARSLIAAIKKFDTQTIQEYQEWLTENPDPNEEVQEELLPEFAISASLVAENGKLIL